MLKFSESFAPANLSMFFTTAKSGSKGLGFTLSKGVYARVYLQNLSRSSEIYFNNKQIVLPVVENTIHKLSKKKFRVELSSDLPLGAGFGLSASCALATGYAIRNLLNLNKTDLEIARFAHQSEVLSGTGLGDVINEYYGGCCFKVKSSRFFQRKNIELDTNILYYKVFGSKPTQSLIADKQRLKKLNLIGSKIITEFEQVVTDFKQIKLQTILELSYNFSFKSGLISQQSKLLINQIKANGGQATTLLVGNGVVSNIQFEGCQTVAIFDNQNRI
jgi:pantoate kinase